MEGQPMQGSTLTAQIRKDDNYDNVGRGDGKSMTHVKSFCWSAGKTAGPFTMPAMNWENDAVDSPFFVWGIDSFYAIILMPFCMIINSIWIISTGEC